MQKEALRQQKEEEIARQRELNLRRRSQHQEKLRNAYLSLYDDNHGNYEKMRATFQKDMRASRVSRMEGLKKKQVRGLRGRIRLCW